jgi:5'-nucleotidase
MRILLTNDDSHRSPLLYFLINHFQTLGALTIVTPKEEQSWTGKSMTRFRPLYVDEIVLDDERHAFCVDGTPADCVNLGLNHLMPEKPDIIVSGINVGRNTGVGFAISSGTVGACLEGNIAGIPGIAFSQDLESEVFYHWVERREFTSEVVEGLKERIMPILSRITDYLLDGRCEDPITWNVNIPYQPAESCALVHTLLGHSFYDSCFEQVGAQYRHNLRNYRPDLREQADSEVVKKGHVSITRIDLRDLGGL